jgi:hypothetical protein
MQHHAPCRPEHQQPALGHRRPHYPPPRLCRQRATAQADRGDLRLAEGDPRGCARPVIAVSPVWGGFLPSPPPPTTWSACPSYWVRRRKHARSVPQCAPIAKNHPTDPGQSLRIHNQRGYQIYKLHNVIKNQESFHSLLNEEIKRRTPRWCPSSPTARAASGWCGR